jgi:hypothetical protein
MPRDPATGSASPVANFEPNELSAADGSAAFPDFVLQWQSIVRYVRDAIAMAGDKQKENADKRSRKNMETFKVGERVLLSVTGITAHAVTNLGANKLLPRYIGPFRVVAALGDAYTLDIRTAMRLHPAFYVG